jgi:hypothetical protein
VNPYDLTTIRGTSNVSSVEWNDTLERYEITIEGQWVSINHVTIANVRGDGPAIITPSSVGGRLLVYISDLEGNPVQNKSFNWVVYRF